MSNPDRTVETALDLLRTRRWDGPHACAAVEAALRPAAGRHVSGLTLSIGGAVLLASAVAAAVRVGGMVRFEEAWRAEQRALAEPRRAGAPTPLAPARTITAAPTIPPATTCPPPPVSRSPVPALPEPAHPAPGVAAIQSEAPAPSPDPIESARPRPAMIARPITAARIGNATLRLTAAVNTAIEVHPEIALSGNRIIISFTPPCEANCDGSSGAPLLTIADIVCFMQRFAAGDEAANCDGSTTAPTLTAADVTCFLQRFAEGCP